MISQINFYSQIPGFVPHLSNLELIRQAGIFYPRITDLTGKQIFRQIKLNSIANNIDGAFMYCVFFYLMMAGIDLFALYPFLNETTVGGGNLNFFNE
jgi:hypothetical protein